MKPLQELHEPRSKCPPLPPQEVTGRLEAEEGMIPPPTDIKSTACQMCGETSTHSAIYNSVTGSHTCVICCVKAIWDDCQTPGTEMPYIRRPILTGVRGEMLQRARRAYELHRPIKK